jgi:ABC-type cobalamin/Fe3+-siderophores transport system ATPase subunit
MGANGTGKSSLMEYLFTGIHVNAHQINNVRRISAHRQTWFPYNTLDLSSQQKKNVENIRSGDTNIDVPWKDDYANQHATISTYDLIDAENVRARSIADALDRQEIEYAKNLSKKDSPIRIINEILSLSKIPVKISIGKNDQVVASKSGSTPYSIAKLSDGERNALLIAANVLTLESGTLVLIDEPERHLHRSIISPFLTHLFSKREDCAFIISTHDVMLPLDNPDARTLLLRDCIYEGASLKSLDIDIVPPETKIDDDIKKDILGARKKIVFVEGEENSLDKPLYRLVFPEDVSIIPKSNCRNVEHTVSSIRSSDDLHWVKPFGIVDNDLRPEADLAKLNDNDIYALPVYSVESIYYHPDIQGLIAQRQADINGGDASTYLDNARAAAMKQIKEDISLLTLKVAEKRTRERFFLHTPKRENIKNLIDVEVSIPVSKIVEEESKWLQDLLDNDNYKEIILKYPIHKTKVLDKIAKELKFKERKDYEEDVRKLLTENQEALNLVESLLGPIISKINAE